MSVKLSTGDKNRTMNDRAAAYTGGAIFVYSGPQPVSPNAAATGILLGIVTENGLPWIAGNPANGLRFKPAEDGVLQKVDAPWRMTGLAKGTAGWCRFVTNVADDGSQSDVLDRFDLPIGISGGSAEVKLSSTAIDVGVPVTVDRCIFRQLG